MEEASSPQLASNFFETYQKINNEVNNKCFDCDMPSPNWASVNNGIMICLSCSAMHRSMGNHYSIVRSTKLDKWTERQLALMEHGGNDKLHAFFDKYDLSTSDLQSKYQSKAA